MRNTDIQNELNSIKDQKYAKMADSRLLYAEQSYNKWYTMYELAKQYRIDHNGSAPTEDYITKDGITLGKWEGTQREFRKSNELSQDRIDLLDAINFSWNVFDVRWDNAYNELKNYKKKYKNVDVSISYTTDNGFKLGEWCFRQRKLVRKIPPSHTKRNGKALSAHRKKLLNDIGFVWTPSQSKKKLKKK